MKILFVYSGKARGGGLDLVVRQELQALVEAGHCVDFLARGSYKKPGIRNLTLRWTPANLISSLPSEYYYNAQHRFFSQLGAVLVRLGNYDMVIGWVRQSRNLFRAADKAGVYRVLNCTNWHFNYPLGKGIEVKRPWPLYKRSDREEEFQRADLLLTASEFARDTFLLNKYEEEKVVSIGRGADLSSFSMPDDRPERPFRVVFLGRVCERKGIFQLLEAWQKAALSSAELWVVGSIPKEIEKNLRSSADSTVTFWGHHDQPEKYLKQCHVQILPSRNEGMAKSLVEGAACGLVTLATRETGFPIQEGVTGFEIKRNDTDAIAIRLRELAENPQQCRNMGRSASDYVKNNLTWEMFHSRFIAAITSHL